MIPKSFSASAAQTFEDCPARWVAENHKKTPQPSSNAADLGTACHTALEKFVAGKFHLKHADHYDTLISFFTEAYEEIFSDNSRYEEGIVMLHTWWERQDWKGRGVLSTELKDHFIIKVNGHEIQFNFIWDRADEVAHPEGKCVIEIIDYKTVSRPISASGLRDKIQARCYGLAGQIKYPKADRVWVKFDLLRYESVGTVFTRDDNVATYRYLQRLLARILEMDEDSAPEKLNANCRWCIRKQTCKALQENIAAGGVFSVSTPTEAAAKRYELENKSKAIGAAITELDEFLLRWAETEGVIEFDAGDLEVQITARKTRALDSGQAVHTIGPELLAEYGTLGVTAVDKLLKDTRLSDEQRAELRSLIRVKFSDPKVQVTPKNPVDGS